MLDLIKYQLRYKYGLFIHYGRIVNSCVSPYFVIITSKI